MISNAVLMISTLLIGAAEGKSVNYDDLIENTVTIVKSCTTSKQISALLLAGEYNDFFQRSLLGDLPVALISESKSDSLDSFALIRYYFAEFKKFSFIRLLCKLNEFVVVASSQPLLRLLLRRIKDSNWFNINGFYVLIDKKTEKYGCLNAYRFLRAAWEYELLSTIFFCIDPVEGLLIYTYNPYSNVIPSEWKNAGRFKGRNGHPWTLLKRKYRDGPRMCKDLHFDKTSDLNGYEVRMNAISFLPHLRIDPEKRGLDKFTGNNGEIIKLVLHKLNASLNVVVHNGSIYQLGGIGPHGNPVGMLAELDMGLVDMGMNDRRLYAMWRLGTTYPHDQDGVCVITQRAGEVSEFVKVVSFISLPVTIGNIVVFIIALCLLAKYKGILPAVLDVIRLITNVSIHRLPRSIAVRVFFVNAFILILIMNSLLQSHLASLLSVPVSRPNIRTAEDLKVQKSNCTIYGSKHKGPGLQDPELRSRFQAVSYDECKERVLHSRSAACLDDCSHLYVRIKDDSRMFFRSQSLQQNLKVYVTRDNWSLLSPVTKLIQRSVEGGIVGMWKRASRMKMYRAWRRRLAKELRSYRTLTMKNVRFCFYTQGFGCILSTVIFVFEILIARYKSGIIKLFRRFGNRKGMKKLRTTLKDTKEGTSKD